MRLAVPLLARGHGLGVIVLLACRGRRFGPDDVRLGEDLARLVSAAVDTSRLYLRAQEAVAARDDSCGAIDSVTDEEILEAYRLLAQEEGIFCEPASAASVAGLRKAAADGRIDPGATIVAVLTGLGLKDPDTGASLAVPPLDAVPTVESVRSVLGW